MNIKITFSPPFNLLMVDARDVAKACYLAAKKGKSFERYVISHPDTISIKDVFLFAQKQFPERKIKTPGRISRSPLLFLAGVSEVVSKVMNKPPLMTREDVKEFWNIKMSADLTKAKRDLGLVLMPLEESIRDTFQYIEKMKIKA